MKVLSLLFLTFFLGKSCDSESKQDVETAVIEYVANTRGFYQKITVQKQMYAVSKDRNSQEAGTPKKITDAQWKKIIAAFQEVTLEELPNLKSPTEKRFYDGAAVANFKITFKGKTYESTAFDHGNPPVQIEKLVTIITDLAKE
jgi:hypothetical protein